LGVNGIQILLPAAVDSSRAQATGNDLSVSEMHMSIASAHSLALTSLILVAGSLSSFAETASTTSTTSAGAPGATIWIHPLLKRYGGVHPRPDLAASLPAGLEYKVIADVVHGSADHDRALGSLQRLARLANLLAYAGVPQAHVHIAAVIEGEATSATLKNEAFRKRFKVDNPNLELLSELKRSGIQLMVCAQTLAENDVLDSDISSDVTITLSALTDLATYEARGYGYLQL
jgi:intracellular sulfur oxidation DsrE/DsrF family protein